MFNRGDFEKGGWVRAHTTSYGDVIAEVASVDKANLVLLVDFNTMGKFIIGKSKAEKLPGRPLTTDDLMQRLGGVEFDVECHACGCGKSGGVKSKLTFKIADNGITFYHIGSHEMLATFDKQGSIVFADGVEGHIYVIE